MKDAKKNHQKWQLLCQHIDPGTEKSISSKASAPRSRYTPKKTILRTPENKLNLVTLKNREITPSQISSRAIKFSQKEGIRKQQNSLVVQPLSLKFINRPNNSIDHDYWGKAHKQKNQVSETDFVVQQRVLSKEQNLSYDPTNQKYQIEYVPKPFILAKLDTFTENGQFPPILRQSSIKYASKQQITVQKQEKCEQKKEQKEQKNQLSVEKIFQNCVAGLNIIEQEMMSERLQVHHLLEEKQKSFIEFKQRLLKIFATKEKQIKKLQNRKIIEAYLLQQQQQQPQIPRNTLMRVTSQRIFNRNQRDLGEENITQRQPSAYGRSVQSRTDSLYKKNFDRIFNTINKLKSELSDDPIQTQHRINQVNNGKQTAQPVRNGKNAKQQPDQNGHSNNITKINTIYANTNMDIHDRINLIKNMNIGTQNNGMKNSGRFQDRLQLRNNVNQQSDRKYTGSNNYVEQWRAKLQRYKV